MTAISAAFISGATRTATAASTIGPGGASNIGGANGTEYVIVTVAWTSVTGVGATDCTMASATMTWTQLHAPIAQAADGTNTLYITAFGALCNGNSEAPTVTMTGGSTVVVAGLFSGVRFSGSMDLSGTNGINVLVRSSVDNTGSGTTPSVAMTALNDAVNNAEFVVFCQNGSNHGTPKTGFTENVDGTVAGAGITILLYAEFKLGQDTTPNFTTANSGPFVVIAFELKASAGGVVVAVFINHQRQMRSQ